MYDVLQPTLPLAFSRLGTMLKSNGMQKFSLVSLIEELKYRNVIKVGIAYLVTAWMLWQLSGVAMNLLSLPEWVPKFILLILVIGFAPALILAWGFELTPEGLKLENEVVRTAPAKAGTGHKLEYLIVISFGLSFGLSIFKERYEQKVAEVESVATQVESQRSGEPDLVNNYSLAGVDKHSIAVLPFDNRSPNPDDSYFADGIQEDLLIQLSRIEALSVISRASVMEYRDTTKNLRQVAHELQVANVLEGAVQRSGDRVRINVQLIDAHSDEHLWAEIYDRELTASNLFDIQSEIARSIAAALKATLTESELASVDAVPTNNVAAYESFLKARQLTQNETMSDYRAAVGLYTESLALDPGFKFAWIGLARAHMTNYWVYGGDPENIRLALEAIEHARSIDANFAELYVAEGFYWYWGHLDYERALYKLGKAIEMMPGNDEAYMWQGWVSRRAGLWEQARQAMQEALRLNPRVHFNWHEYALTNLYMHRYEDAKKAAVQARVLAPDSFWGRTTLARVVLEESGNIETALQLTDGAQNAGDFNFFESFMLARILARQYDEALAAARGIGDELEIQRNRIDLREAWAAQALYFMGRRDEARQAAAAALVRLNGLRSKLGTDYRLDLAEAMVGAIQGAGSEKVRSLVDKSMSSRPTDAVEAFRFKLEYARIFGIAGMTPEAIEMLEPLLQPPSDTSVYTVDLDAAFDAIRDDPDFAAMMEQHR